MLELRHFSTSGRLPTSTFHLLVDGRAIGRIQIRHKPSRGPDIPPGGETHVYYEIEPSERLKGYGKEILRLGLIEARKLGLTEVFIGADAWNIGSWKIIERNGGQLIGTFKRLDTGEPSRHYRIDLASK
jgi:predicted acetyltransferase